jgi:hypothetical protein
MSYPWINEAVVSDMTQTDQQVAAALTAMTVAATQLVPLWQIKVQGMQDGWWMSAQLENTIRRCPTCRETETGHQSVTK